MNKSTIFSVAMAVTTVGAAWIGCTSNAGAGSSTTSTTTGGDTTTTTASTSSSGSSATTTSATGTGGTGTGTGGSFGAGGGSGGAGPDGGAGIFSCNTPPATPPSAGSCVTVVAVNDAGTGIECNPVTNAPCSTGEQCDVNTDNNSNIIGWLCWPPPNNATVCQNCNDSNGPTCVGGTTCFGTDSSGSSSACAQYCCTDADCGSSGKCTTEQGGTAFFGPLAPSLGICAAM